MTVPFLDLGAAYREMTAEIDAAVGRVLRSGMFVGGPEVAAFEQAFAAYTGAVACTGTANGLDALHLALRAMGVGPGDEVIVAANGFVATFLAVSMAGAVPVPVEPDPATHNLDSRRIADAITPRTKVILPTHLYGQPADMDAILAIARDHGLKVLEDGAQAHGSRYKGRPVGAHGDAVTWSFYPSKNLGCLGDGGAVTGGDAELIDRVRILGNYGSHVRYVNDVRGVNSRLDPIHAAVLAAKVDRLDRWNDRRRAIAARYLAELADTDLILPVVPDWADPVWHLFVVRSRTRDALKARLDAAGVQTLIHYPIPPHLQKAYADLGYKPGDFPIAEQLATEVLSLPIGPHMTDAEIDAVIDAVRG